VVIFNGRRCPPLLACYPPLCQTYAGAAIVRKIMGLEDQAISVRAYTSAGYKLNFL